MYLNALIYASFQSASDLFPPVLQKAFKYLLEQKHLYQNLQVDWPTNELINAEMQRKAGRKISDEETAGIQDLSRIIAWELINPREQRRLAYIESGTAMTNMPVEIQFAPPTIKIYCRNCQRQEPFKFEKGIDILGPYRTYDPNQAEDHQVFSLDYRCQNCDGDPEVFMIQRSGLKLSIVGRAPMEVVLVSSVYPKGFRKYISGAMIAFNSGQSLAANFMLRTFIEQFVRSESVDKNTENIDNLLAEYKQRIPDEIKPRIPSLQKIYDDLSIDIHAAEGSEELFQESLNQLEKHFDIKRALDI